MTSWGSFLIGRSGHLARTRMQGGVIRRATGEPEKGLLPCLPNTPTRFQRNRLQFVLYSHAHCSEKSIEDSDFFFVISFKKMWRYLLALVFQVTNLMANHPGSFQFIIQECQGWRGALALSLLGRSVNPSIPTRVGGGFFPPFTNGTPIFFQLRQLLLNAK